MKRNTDLRGEEAKRFDQETEKELNNWENGYLKQLDLVHDADELVRDKFDNDSASDSDSNSTSESEESTKVESSAKRRRSDDEDDNNSGGGSLPAKLPRIEESNPEKGSSNAKDFSLFYVILSQMADTLAAMAEAFTNIM